MPLSRRSVIAMATACALPGALKAKTLDVRTSLMGLEAFDPNWFFKALIDIEARGGTDLVSSLIFAMRFSRAPDELFDPVLRRLTGEERSGWEDWMLWQEVHPEIASHPEFYEYKRERLLRIDPEWEVFLKPEYVAPEAMKIRFEEVTWGGVVKDGIPALDNPSLVAAGDANYLLDDDLVFGVEIDGDVRAYPLRVMGWHEMFNEVVGGVPVALAYCTLCGSGILFETRVDRFEDPLIFGTSGFLYRSNKLMYDRATHSLWNQFTGKPVSGPLSESGIELKQRPVVIASWKSWREANPDTLVLSLNTGYLRDYGSGVVYQNYFASDDLMFPTQVDESMLKQKDYVFGVRVAGGAKAWPLTAFEGQAVINDKVGFTDVVLIGDAAQRTVRAYDRKGLTFAPDLSADGVNWSLTEAALVAEDGRQLPRVAGHIAYWFAWNGYLGSGAEFYKG